MKSVFKIEIPNSTTYVWRKSILKYNDNELYSFFSHQVLKKKIVAIIVQMWLSKAHRTIAHYYYYYYCIFSFVLFLNFGTPIPCEYKKDIVFI